jgi:predicted nuclease with TOPRIM domain
MKARAEAAEALVAQEREAREKAERKLSVADGMIERRDDYVEKLKARCAELEAELERWRNGLEDSRA